MKSKLVYTRENKIWEGDWERIPTSGLSGDAPMRVRWTAAEAGARGTGGLRRIPEL